MCISIFFGRVHFLPMLLKTCQRKYSLERGFAGTQPSAPECVSDRYPVLSC